MFVSYVFKILAVYLVIIGLSEASDTTCSAVECSRYHYPQRKHGNKHEQCTLIGPLCDRTRISTYGKLCKNPAPGYANLRIQISPVQATHDNSVKFAQNGSITMRFAVDSESKITVNSLFKTWGKPQNVPGEFPSKSGQWFYVTYAITGNQVEIYVNNDKRDTYTLDERFDLTSNHELCVYGCSTKTYVLGEMTTERCQDCDGCSSTWTSIQQYSGKVEPLGGLLSGDERKGTYMNTWLSTSSWWSTSSDPTSTRSEETPTSRPRITGSADRQLVPTPPSIKATPDTQLEQTPPSIKATPDTQSVQTPPSLKATPETDKTEDESLTHEEVLTFVGLTFSMFFLILTMISLVYNKNITNTPGKIMFSLCLSLFLAQFLFLFIDYPFGSTLTCKVLAIVEHFLWLLAMSWSNIMVIDLVRVIGNTKPMLHRACLNRYPFYAVVTGIFPCAIITSCTILDSRSTIVTYGIPGFCWINFSRARTYFFIIPLGVSILINVVLLITIFVMIYIIRRGTTAIGEGTVLSHRRNAIIVLKLASATGLTWIFGFLGGILQNTVLLYLFTLINSFQGVIIFFALAYNHSKLKAWLRKIRCCKRDVEATPTEQNVS